MKILFVGGTIFLGRATVEAALAAGVTDVGENRVQEFLSKEPGVTSPCRWHLIGHLQTNKVNKVIGKFSMIHSIDSFKLAEKLSSAGETGNSSRKRRVRGDALRSLASASAMPIRYRLAGGASRCQPLLRDIGTPSRAFGIGDRLLQGGG